MAQLDDLRRLEVDATRDDKRLALGLLGAEVSHEIAYPLNFFRYLLKQGAQGRPLDEQDVEIGREEVERLERMVAALRRLKPPSPKIGRVSVLAIARRAVDLLREQFAERRVEARIEVAPDLTVAADPDPLLQLFANLLRNAAQAARDGGHVGVVARREAHGTVFDVWDDGPGVPEGLEETIFNPWVTTKQDSSGLGLAITQRIARSLGWHIAFHREDGRTVFRVTAPATQASAKEES